MPYLTAAEIKTRAERFAVEWSSTNQTERSDAQTFWTDLFDVFGISRRRVATFECRIGKGFADLFWPGVLLAESKSPGLSLDRAMDQAMGYVSDCSDDELPRWIVVTDMLKIRIRDLDTDEEVIFSVSDLPTRYQALDFLRSGKADWSTEEMVTRKAADSLAALYRDLVSRGYNSDAMILVSRLAYLMFAEDAGILDRHCFRDLLLSTRTDAADLGPTLIALFQWLDTPIERRMLEGDPRFEPFIPIPIPEWFDSRISIPSLGPDFRSLLIQSSRLDWSAVDPVVFGTLFESLLSADERRATGSHYTSERDVMRVLKPTILDRLETELLACAGSAIHAARFQARLSKLRILDPACGSGNFLSVALKRIMDLDSRASRISNLAPAIGPEILIGLEIQTGASLLARLCIEISFHQSRMSQLSMGSSFPSAWARNPLIENTDALTTPWEDIIPYENLACIVGNPPFLGSKGWTPEIRTNLKALYKPLNRAGIKRTGSLDLCAAWLVLSARALDRNPAIRIGLVTTNSLIQGSQPAPLWDSLRHMCSEIKLVWARTSTPWSGSAGVHIVMFGLGVDGNDGQKSVPLWTGDSEESQSHMTVGPYMIPGVDILIRARSKPWSSETPLMVSGNMPNDGGHLILSRAEKDSLLENWPETADLIRPFYGARELLHHDRRWCLWLHNIDPVRWAGIPAIRERVERVRLHRLASKAATTRKAASRPAEFLSVRSVGSLVVPETSSERRIFIVTMPLTGILSNAVYTTNPSSFPYISSRMHRLWVGLTAGRLDNRIRYSASFCYNPFPFPDPSPEQRAGIETAAQQVLDARTSYPDRSLAQLYDPLTMPTDLLEAHTQLDLAIESAYRKEPFSNDEERLAHLLMLYKQNSDESDQ